MFKNTIVSKIFNKVKIINKRIGLKFKSIIKNKLSEEYVSCTFIEWGLSFLGDEITPCCRNTVKGCNGPQLANYQTENINLDDIEKARQEIRRRHMVGDISVECEHCPQLCKLAWGAMKPGLTEINIVCFEACNISCIYCHVASDTTTTKEHKNIPKIAPIITDLSMKGEITEYTTVRISGGEPAIWPELEEVINILIKCRCKVVIYSNAARFSDAINESLMKGHSTLYSSLDTPYAETYKQIKQRDFFPQTLKNLIKYNASCFTKAGLSSKVIVKFIIMPENIHEAPYFIDFIHSSGFQHICFSLDNSQTLASGMRRDVRYFTEEELIPVYAKICLECWLKGLLLSFAGTELAWFTESRLVLLRKAVAEELKTIPNFRFTPYYCFGDYEDSSWLISTNRPIFDGSVYLSNDLVLNDFTPNSQALLNNKLNTSFDMIESAYDELNKTYIQRAKSEMPILGTSGEINLCSEYFWGSDWGIVKNNACVNSKLRFLGPLGRSTVFLKLPAAGQYELKIYIYSIESGIHPDRLHLSSNFTIIDQGYEFDGENHYHQAIIDISTEYNVENDLVELEYSVELSAPLELTPKPSCKNKPIEISFTNITYKQI